MRVLYRSPVLCVAVILAGAGAVWLGAPQTSLAQAPPPADAIGVDDASQQLVLYANAHPYMDDALPELEQRVPELKGLRSPEESEPDRTPGANGNPGTSGEDPLPALLVKLGANVDRLAQKIPDMVADEQVSQAEWVSGAGDAPDCSHGPQCVGGSVAEKTQNFHYLILVRQTPQGRFLDEDRRDMQNRPLQASSLQPNFLGFVESWLILAPENRNEVRIRFLGEQKVRGHPAFVIAFAQIPGAVHVPGTIRGASRTVPMLLQGIGWVDQRDGQILQLRTDLLEPQLEVNVLRQTSEIRFGPVPIKQLHLRLWLPLAVDVDCEANGMVLEEKHLYSKYHLYQATSRMIVNPSN